MAVLVNPPCVLFEDEHLLVVNKPPGWNTHSPAPYAGEGIYEWLKNREPRWAKLAIIHRLDKETSGLMVFSKTTEANRSLTRQFTEGRVRKEYILESTEQPPKKKFVVRSTLVRVGERYFSQRGATSSGAVAETEFELLEKENDRFLVLARPRTGRTHQIRVHAAENGFPIRGDILYGGKPYLRLCLHSHGLDFDHPITNNPLTFGSARFFEGPIWFWRRHDLFDGSETDSHRCIHGASDAFNEWHVDQFGSYLLSQSPSPISDEQRDYLQTWLGGKGVYHKITTVQVRAQTTEESNPKHVAGSTAPGPFAIQENGVNYEINFSEGYSVGIFLDQRDNRRRLLTNYIAPDFWVYSQHDKVGPAVLSAPLGRATPLAGAEVLNTFAYTCAFSVWAALAGARVTSLDLSKKYLDWGRRNFQLNGLDPAEHAFIYGDVFDWLKRFAKKQRQFDVVLLDPPTFSKSKESGIFRAENDYGRLVMDAVKVLKPGGTLFASSNAARWAPEDFVKTVREALANAGRKILREHYVPQPPDFPISKAEPAYLKTIWLKVN
jgi:23S rRNA (cytosine1962-C5)-methyltransferase